MNEPRPLDPLGLSAEIVELWNRRARAAFPLDGRLLRQLVRMERGESLWLGSFDAGRLVGAALAKLPRPSAETPPADGFLSFIAVEEDHGRRGLGSALLARAEAWVAEAGARRLHFGGDSYHFFPGLPVDDSASSRSLGAFLQARGFRPKGPDEEDLVADLSTLDLQALVRRAPLAAGYRFRLYDASLRDATETFFRREFPGRWYREFLDALEEGLRNLDLALLQDEASGEVVGFSRIYDQESPVLGGSMYWRALMGDSPGGLGPIGLAHSLRGKGLGLALLRLCVEELAHRGVRTMVIDWTSLGAFYGKLGFAPWKAYRSVEKVLTPS